MHRIPIVRAVPLKRLAPTLLTITILCSSMPAQSHDDGRTYAVSTTRLEQLSALTATAEQTEQTLSGVIPVAHDGKITHAGGSGVQGPKPCMLMKLDSILWIERILARMVQQ